MTLLAKVYNHGSEEVPSWVVLTCPTAKMPEGKMWKGPGAIAIAGHRGDKLSEIFVYSEWRARNQTVIPLELHEPEPSAVELPFSPHPMVRNDVLCSLRAVFNDHNEVITVVPVEERNSSTPMQKLFVEGLSKDGGRIWCEFWIGLGSGVVQFSGKLEVSDPNNKDALLDSEQSIEIKFGSEANVYFNESGSDFMIYRSSLPDGRAFPFSGYLSFGPPEDTPIVDGSIDGLLFIDGKPAWDKHLPPGLDIMETLTLHHGFESTVFPQSMVQHPLTEKKYTHATGGRYAFGYPGTEICWDPKLIRVLQRASRCECFRPIHRLENGGGPFRRSEHPDLKTHNMAWNSQGGGDSYAFGKRDPHDTGVVIGDWDLQGGEHLSMQDSFVIACIKNDPIAIDTIERAAELQLAQVDYFVQPRHVYRTVKMLACCYQAPVSLRIRNESFNYISDFIPRVLDYMDSDDAHRGTDVIPLVGYDFVPYNSWPREGGRWWDVIQNGLVGSLPMALELAGIVIMDERYEPYFLQVTRATLWEGLFQDGFGIWRAHWSVRDDEHGSKPANSHKAIIRQCAPGLKWLYDKTDNEDDKSRILSVLASVDDGSSDARRYLI